MLVNQLCMLLLQVPIFVIIEHTVFSGIVSDYLKFFIIIYLEVIDESLVPNTIIFCPTNKYVPLNVILVTHMVFMISKTKLFADKSD